MSSTRPSVWQEKSGQHSPGSSGEARLSTLIYRSRAVAPLSESELHRILDAARSRNRAAAVTGLLIYDNGRFFQWLEGPAESVSRIWNSIRTDERHTDIEILGDEPSSHRIFGDWDMKLGLRNPPSDGKRRDTVQTPAGLIESLNQHPRDAGFVLASLAPVAIPEFEGYAPPPGTSPDRSRDEFVPFILQNIINADVIPALVRRHPLMTPDVASGAINSSVADLARRLLSSDPESAFELIDRLQSGGGSIAQLCANSFEPAARALGDLWSNDDCSEVDVSLGLNQMQMAVRRGPLALVPVGFHGSPMPAVLVATQPGEIHSLTATLDAEVLWHDGWDTHCEHPESDEELDDMVAESWFDALDLSLSTAFRHDDWLPRMTRTIARARKASRNPSLAVVVGGRVFYEQRDAGKRVGADAGVSNAQQLGQLILEALRRKS
jgi:methanogenic corrinoid protein MtbC1